MKTKTMLLALLALVLTVPCLLAADAVDATPIETAGQLANSLLLLGTAVLVPVLVRVAKYTVPKIPDWSLPIVAASLAAVVNFLSGLAGGPNVNPLLASLIGFAGVGLREFQDQVRGRITDGAKPVIPGVPALIAFVLAGSMLFSGCAWLKANKGKIEGKAKGVAYVVSAAILKDNPESRADFIQASADLKFVADTAVVDVTTVMAIINRLPALARGDTVIYVNGALIFFGDELSILSVENPEEVRLAAKGFYEGIDLALGAVIPKALKPPTLTLREKLRLNP